MLTSLADGRSDLLPLPMRNGSAKEREQGQYVCTAYSGGLGQAIRQDLDRAIRSISLVQHLQTLPVFRVDLFSG